MSQTKVFKVDDQPSLGEPMISVDHGDRRQGQKQSLSPDVYKSVMIDLDQRVSQLIERVDSLEMRILFLEQRTWWSMLKDAVRGLLPWR